MPRTLFYEIDEQKRERIIDAALNEFILHSYNESSTNRIVKQAGIGKGSLFKYFSNKEDLFFYLIEKGITNLLQELSNEMNALSEDIFERIIEFSAFEIIWYIKNPKQYKLFKIAFMDKKSTIYQKVIDKYGVQMEHFYYRVFEDIREDAFKADKTKVLNLIKWVLKGFSEAFIEQIKEDGDVSFMQTQYTRELKEYLSLLKAGL